MAYNLLTGSIYRVPSSSLALTGTFAGDGRELINTPGPNYVTNGGTTRLVTFANAAGSTVNGEANLTFDGSALTVTGEVTASIGVNANFFEGDGSRLTGITASAGTAGGIFTELSPSSAYTTSSLLIGGTTAPNHTLSISGTLSASSNLSASAFYGDASYLRFGRTSITDHHTAAIGEHFIGVDSSSKAISVELNATYFDTGYVLTIKDEAGNAGSNNVTITASTDQTIDGEGTVAIESPYGAINIYTNGTDAWWIY